jgi:chromosomal replication initiator protein
MARGPHRFASFVADPRNEAALAAARAAAAQPGGNGRLLVIAGAAGLGKTHLLRAIVNEVRAVHPELRTGFCETRTVYHAGIRALIAGRPVEPPRRLQGLDVLAVDGLQFLANRMDRRVACAPLLEQAAASCRQIVVGTVDPGDVEALAAFGVPTAEMTTVQLARPEPATRIRIATLRARHLGIALPGEVARFLAQWFARDVRMMENALVRLAAEGAAMRRALTPEFVADVLFARLPAPKVTPPPRPDPVPLEAGIQELREFVAEVGGSRIGEPDIRGRTIHVPLVARDDERYVLRLEITQYLTRPPRCSFVDARYEPAPEAWPHPDPRGPFRSPNFICTPPTAEFYRYHSERVYSPAEGSLANTVATVFAALNAPEYRGRFHPRRRPG